MTDNKNRLPKKIKINESQYDRIFSGNMQIIGDEFEGRNPHQMNEQDLMGWVNDATNWLDKNIGDPVSDAADYVSDGVVNGLTSAGNTIADAASEVYQYTQDNTGTQMMMDLVGIIDQGTKPMRDNIDHNWDDWVEHDWPWIKNDVKRAFSEIPDALWKDGGNFKRLYDLFTDVETWKGVSLGWKMIFDKLTDPEEYKKVPEGFKMLFQELSTWPGELIDWLSTWTVQDWIDLAAIILFCIPTPATWGAALALEGVNVGISAYKGDWGEAGIRALFIVGGALLSKTMSTTYKVSAKTAKDTRGVLSAVATKAEKEGWEQGSIKTTQYLDDLLKNSTSEVQTYTKDIMQHMKNSGSKEAKKVYATVASKMSKIENRAFAYMRKYPGIREEVAFYRATNDVMGKNWTNNVLKHVAPQTAKEAKILGVLYSGILSAQFIVFLQMNNYTQESVGDIEKLIGEVSKELETDTKEAEKWLQEQLEKKQKENNVNTKTWDQDQQDKVIEEVHNVLLADLELDEEIKRIKSLLV